jgi:hypothetical protein
VRRRGGPAVIDVAAARERERLLKEIACPGGAKRAMQCETRPRRMAPVRRAARPPAPGHGHGALYARSACSIGTLPPTKPITLREMPSLIASIAAQATSWRDTGGGESSGSSASAILPTPAVGERAGAQDHVVDARRDHALVALVLHLRVMAQGVAAALGPVRGQRADHHQLLHVAGERIVGGARDRVAIDLLLFGRAFRFGRAGRVDHVRDALERVREIARQVGLDDLRARQRIAVPAHQRRHLEFRLLEQQIRAGLARAAGGANQQYLRRHETAPCSMRHPSR